MRRQRQVGTANLTRAMLEQPTDDDDDEDNDDVRFCQDRSWCLDANCTLLSMTYNYDNDYQYSAYYGTSHKTYHVANDW